VLRHYDHSEYMPMFVIEDGGGATRTCFDRLAPYKSDGAHNHEDYWVSDADLQLAGLAGDVPCLGHLYMCGVAHMRDHAAAAKPWYNEAVLQSITEPWCRLRHAAATWGLRAAVKTLLLLTQDADTARFLPTEICCLICTSLCSADFEPRL